MPTERLCMRHTREILRHKWLLRSGHRLVRTALGVSHGVITHTTQRAVAAGLSWESVCALSDAELELRLYPPPLTGAPRPEPDFAYIDLELRKKGVTRELLHQEYLAQHPDGLRRSAFCARYDAWKQTRGLTMRQSHKGGDKLFVDYAGMKAYYTDPATGARVACELFVAALGASSYTYAEASPSQKAPDFLASHVRALTFFDGVPEAIVSDQLKSGVVVPCRYEPGPHTAYLDFAQHYNTALVPARPRSPRGRVERWRGGVRLRGVAVSDRFRVLRRCLIPILGSVSSARSSNRTCGSPASGSHLDRQTFVLGWLTRGTVGRYRPSLPYSSSCGNGRLPLPGFLCFLASHLWSRL